MGEMVAVNFTPSNRKADDKSRTITYYDDRFMVETALDENGVILTNDHFKDIKATLKPQENSRDKTLKDVIEQNCLSYMFIKTRPNKAPTFKPAQMPWNNKDKVGSEKSITLEQFL